MPPAPGDEESVLDYLQRFFPEASLRKIVASRDDPFELNERRHAVVMFADVSGFTAISERLDPETLTELMNSVFRAMGSRVTAHRGMIDKFLGDCILCVFGIMDGSEPERDACLCALEARAAVRALGDSAAERWGLRLDLSVGINSGPLLIGTVGWEDRMEYTVMGDTVNTASRIQHEAEPGQILVSEGVMRRVRFRFADMGRRRMKNKREPVLVYQLQGEAEEAAGPQGLPRLPPLGRDGELALILGALEDPEHPLRSILLTGDAGTGKTEILGWVARSIARDPSWTVIRPVVERSLGERASNPVRRLLADRLPSGASMGRDNLKAAFAGFLLDALSERPGLLFILDDAEALDDDGRAIIDEARAILAAKRAFFLMARRGAEGSWPQADSILRLVGLDAPSAALLCERVIGAPPSPELAAFVLRRTMGNPYFAQELLTDLLERGIVLRDGSCPRLGEAETGLPSSVANIVLHKAETLDWEERRALRYAAVAGDEIPLSVLSRLSGLSREALVSLAERLSALNIAYLREEEGMEKLRFAHQTAREAIASAVLDRARAGIHAQVADALVAGGLASGTEGNARAARHYEEGGATAKAVFHWFQSAAASREEYDFPSAQRSMDRAIRLARAAPAAASYGIYEAKAFDQGGYFLGIQLRGELDLPALHFFRALSHDVHEREYLSNLEECLALEPPDPLLRYLAGEARIFNILVVAGSPPERLLPDFDALLARCRSPITELLHRSDRYFCQILSYAGLDAAGRARIAADYEALEKAFSRLDERRDPIGPTYPYFKSLLALARATWTAVGGRGPGEADDDALARDIEAGAAWQEPGNGLLSYYGFILGNFLGDRPALRRSYELTSLSLAERVGNAFLASMLHGSLGYSLLVEGRHDEALSHFQQALEITVRMGNELEESMAHYNLGQTEFLRGRLEESLACAERAMRIRLRRYEDRDSAGFSASIVALRMAALSLLGRHSDVLDCPRRYDIMRESLTEGEIDRFWRLLEASSSRALAGGAGPGPDELALRASFTGTTHPVIRAWLAATA